MYADIDKDGKISLHDMDPAEAELIQTDPFGRRNQFQRLYAPEGGDGDRQSFSESIQNIKANMIIYEKNSINNQTRSVSGY